MEKNYDFIIIFKLIKMKFIVIENYFERFISTHELENQLVYLEQVC